MNSISSKVLQALINYNIVNEKEIPLYEYGLKIIAYKIGYMISLISICFILQRSFINLLIFYFSFVLLRKYSGGYHAKNYISCMLLFLLVYLCLDLGVSLFQTMNDSLLFVYFLIISVLIYLKSPIDCANKRLTSYQKVKNKKKTLFVLILLISTYIICNILNITNISFTILYSVSIILHILKSLNYYILSLHMHRF